MSWENDPIAPGAAPWENDPVAGPSTKEVLSTAVKVNPDQAARAARLAKTYQAPQDVLVRNLQNVELIDAVNKADQRLQTSPKLAEYMRNSPFVAQQAHDDIEPLARIESNMAAVGAAAAGRGVLSISESIWRTPDAAQRVVGYVASLPEQLGLPRYLNPIRGVQDAIRFFSEGQLPVGPKLFAGTTDVADRISDASNLLSDDPETFGSAFADVNTLAKNTDQALTTLIETGDPQQLGQVLTSPEYWAAAIGQAAPSLAMALYSGGAPAFLAWMEGMEQASSAADFEQRTGVAVSDAEFVQATAQTALINAWLEKAGLDRILGAQGKGLSGVLKAALAEGTTEALQEINQNLSAMLSYDEGRELLQGAVMAFMGGAGSGGGVSATSQAAGVLQERLSARQREEADAQRRATQLQEALALAAQSKLRERNPETFQQLVQQMAEQTEGAPQSVFIDAQVLLQSATPEQLAQLLPSTAEQLQEAAATNSMIEVPIAEALTNLPGTPLEQVFLQNARANESALSLAEAQQAADQAQEFLKQEADRVMQEAADQDAWVASVEKIKTTLLEQLNTAGRFTPDVNEAYATLVGQFFSVMAARTGTTPEALYARYPLRVTGVQPGQGEQVLNNASARPGALTVEAYHYSKQARPVIDTRMFGTGLRGSNRELYLNAADPRLRNRAYFYVDKGTGINPESGVGGVAHRAMLSNIYDADRDPLGLKRGADQLAFESAVLDAGFSGYLTRLEGTQSGQVILLGEQAVKAEVLGPMGRIEAGQRVPALPAGEPQWQTVASGTPEQLQARLERMRLNPSWDAFDLRIEGDQLQSRARGQVFEQSVSTRVPWARGRNAAAAENPLSDRLQVGLAALKDAPDALAKATDLLVTYPNWPAKWRTKNPDTRVERFVQHVVDNLLYLHDLVPAEIRERAKKWYDGANVIANEFARRYNITLAQASAVLAVNSPQTEWFTNVSRAERILDIWTNQQDFAWSPEMEITAQRILGKEGYAADLAEIRGKTLRDLDGNPTQQAMWLRAYDESHNDRSHRIVTPEGAFGDFVTNADGSNSRTAWASFGHIAKSIEILRDGSIENISARLGNEHKVRSFYNNIFDPNDPAGDVTIDTHAVAAGLLRPLSGSSIEVVHNLGGGVSNALKGLSGTYGIYAEAYRRAAEQRGLLPREMQSITWEAVRGLYTDTFKSSQAAAQVEDLWRQFRTGKLTEDQVRAAALDIAGGINEPNWWQSDRQPPTQSWSSSYGGQLSEFRVPAGGADPAAGRDPSGSGERGRGVQRAAGSDQDRSLAPLEGAPSVAGATGPDPRLVAVAEQYARDNGIDFKRQGRYVAVDEDRARRIAEAYEAMPHAPQDPAVREAYNNLIAQTMAQYRALEAAGYKFWFYDESNDPYDGNPWNAMRDLRANQSMGVFATESGFGSGATDLDVTNNPLLAETGLMWPSGSPDGPMKRVLANDLFRAVHDAFGHGLEGAGFRAQGEENAWQAHVRLFTGSAVAALTSETRGQNSWLNYGPYGEQNRNARVEDTVFADQKTGLMPEWTWTEGRAPDADEGVLNQSAPTGRPNYQTTYTDPQGETYEIRLTQETFGVGAGRELTVQVGAFQGGQRRARVDFEVQGNTLAAGNTITAEAYRGRGLAEAMYRAAREAGYDIMPGRKQTADGERMVARLREKGVINRERPLEHGGDVTQTPEFKRWFGDSKAVVAVNAETGAPVVSSREPKRLVPQVMYHTTRNDFSVFEIGRTTRNSGTFGDWETQRHAIFVTPEVEASQAYGTQGGRFATGANVMPLYVKAERPLNLVNGVSAEDAAKLEEAGMSPRFIYNGLGNWAMFDDEDGAETVALIKKAGYDSVIFNDENPDTGESFEAWALFAPEQIKSAIGNDGTFDANDPSILSQGPRGTFSPRQLLITLGETSDLSTFLHESGHFFLEVMADLASQPGAPAETSADMNALLKWFGVPDLATWNSYTLDQKRKHHERFAESFEQYLLEGKAPSTELQGLFRRFRAWLVAVYKNLTQFMRGRDLQVSDDIRRVFDRMLATDEQIAAAEEAAGMLPDFDATNEAIEQLQSRRLRDMKWMVNARAKAIKALQKQAKELRKGIEAEVRAEVEQQPVYAARKALRAGPKLSIAGLESLYMGEGDRYALLDWKPLVDQKLAGKEGIHPDIAADMFGFANGDALVRAILGAEPIDSVIEGMTDQRMLERHGDLVDERAIQDAANEAVHNEARARVLATELKAQADALNPRQATGRTDAGGRPITVNALVEAAKQFAQNLAARRRVKDLKSAAAQHRAAEARAAKRWQEATAKGDTQAAVQAKRDQLLNNYAAKALQEAQAEVKKMGEFFARVTKGNDEKVVKGGRDPDVVNAMRAILAAHDVAPRLEKGALDYMEAVRVNDPAMYAALQPSVAAAVSNAKPLREMTLEELRGLNDELRAMWLLAKRSRQMEVDGNLLDIEEAADQLVARMQEIGVPDTVPGEKGAITPRQELGIKLQFAKAILSRVEQWAERMDGKFGGPFLRLVFQPIKEAADRYRADRVKYRKRFVALLDNLAPAMPRGPIEAPELGYTFGNARDSGMAELLHALLHTGNDSNKRKLLLGRGWATENPDGTLDTSRWDAFLARMHNEGRLQKVHWDFAQGVWDLLEEMKPLAQETHRKVFGRYFAEVTANVVETPFGTYRGGYVPAQTDARIVRDAKLRELAEGENESMAYAFPAAPSGFTKARVEYNRPLLLDLRALAQHMDKVLLFSHMQGAVNDVRRLLTQKNVAYALDRIDPGAYEGMLIPWLNRAAKQIVETPTVGDRKISRFLSAMRNRAGMALMFANLSNTFQQVTGFSLAAVKVRPGLMVKAMAEFTRSPKAMQQRVAEASAFMKDRMLHEVAAMNDAVESILVDPGLIERGQAWTQKHAYFLQAAADKIMSPIVWTAAYNQAVEGGQSERDAIRFADGVVRQTQGTTLPEDVSRFETGPAAVRLFTQFVSYFNMMANTNATAMKQIVDEVGVRKGAGKLFYVALMGLLVPIWVAEAIAVGMRGGPEDEDDDGYLDDWLAAVFGFGTIRGLMAQVPIVGQAAQLVVNRFNDNPADDKFSLSPAVSLIESSVSAPSSVYKAIVEDGNKMKAARDVAAAATMATGLPIYGVSRPLFYLTGVADDRVEPTSEADFVRGLLTGTASPESRVP